MNLSTPVRLAVSPKLYYRYPEYIRIRLPFINLRSGEVAHVWPSGLVNVRFAGKDGGPSLEMTCAPQDIRPITVRKAA